MTDSLYRMGANRDVVNKFRHEIEEAIEAESNYINDSTDWWSVNVVDSYTRPIDRLVSRIEAIASRYAKDLA